MLRRRVDSAIVGGCVVKGGRDRGGFFFPSHKHLFIIFFILHLFIYLYRIYLVAFVARSLFVNFFFDVFRFTLPPFYLFAFLFFLKHHQTLH